MIYLVIGINMWRFRRWESWMDELVGSFRVEVMLEYNYKIQLKRGDVL